MNTDTYTWWDVICDFQKDITNNDILNNYFIPDHLWKQYQEARDIEPNYMCFTLMTPEEIFMAMCFLSYIYDPEE